MSLEKINKNATTKRDGTLDDIRAMSILWVLATHVLWWTGIIQSNTGIILSSLFLLEMPIIIYITGAANSLSNKKSLFEFYRKRLFRIIIPYWVYAIICVSYIFINSLINNKILPNDFFVSWIFPIFAPFSDVNFLTWALWFIPIYLSVMIIFPFLRKIFDFFSVKRIKYLPMLFFIIVIILIDIFFGLSSYNFLRNIIFYSLWIYIGMFYKYRINKKINKKALFIFIFCLLAVVFLVCFRLYPLNMQLNKFPPNLIYILYTFGALGILYIFSPYIIKLFGYIKRVKVIRLIIEQYSKRGFTIYLFHPFSFLITSFLLNVSGIIYPLLNYEVLLLIMYYILVVIISAILGWIFGWCENINFNFIRNMKIKND